MDPMNTLPMLDDPPTPPISPEANTNPNFIQEILNSSVNLISNNELDAALNKQGVLESTESPKWFQKLLEESKSHQNPPQPPQNIHSANSAFKIYTPIPKVAIPKNPYVYFCMKRAAERGYKRYRGARSSGAQTAWEALSNVERDRVAAEYKIVSEELLYLEREGKIQRPTSQREMRMVKKAKNMGME